MSWTFRPARVSLRVRIGVLLFAGVLMTGTGLYVVLMSLTRQRLLQEQESRTRSFTAQLATRLSTALVLRDAAEVRKELRRGLSEPDLVGIAVYNRDGTLFDQVIRDPSRWVVDTRRRSPAEVPPTAEETRELERRHSRETEVPIQREDPLNSRSLSEVDEMYGTKGGPGVPAGGEIGWVRSVFSTDSADGAVRTAARMGLVVLLAALLVWLVPLLGLLRLIARPLREASDLARAIAHGQLERRIPVRGDDELGTLAESLNTMASALTDARRQAEEEAEAMRRATAAIIAIARGARESTGLDDMFGVVAEQLKNVAESGGAALASPESDTPLIRFHRFDPPPPWGGLVPAAPLEPALARQLDHPGATLRMDVERDESLLARGLRRDGFRAALLVPLDGGGERPHVLLLASSSPEAFSPTQVEIVLGLASHLAAALRATSLHGRLEHAVAELEETRERLERSERLRVAGEMASGVAHDFNNVLAAILGRAQLLQRRARAGDLGESELDRALEVIERAAQDGGDTVQRLRQFGSGRPTAGTEIVDLDAAIRDAAEYTRVRWEGEANSTGRAITLTFDSRPGATVEGRGSEMREVFTNLILNAIDALPEGGTIRLETQVMEDRVTASVEDDGVGMNADVQRRIFDPFFTTKGDRGTGLGLSVVYGIVKAAGGEIQVRSTVGRGTRVEIVLALARPVAADPAAADAGAAAPGPMRVMVVDDEPAVRELLADIVRSLGHACDALSGGAEALACFTPGTYAAVFTDLGMPGMSGWELTRRLREIDSAATIAIITGWGAEVSSESLAEVGADAVVTKPFSIEDIEELMRLAADRAERRAA